MPRRYLFFLWMMSISHLSLKVCSRARHPSPDKKWRSVSRGIRGGQEDNRRESITAREPCMWVRKSIKDKDQYPVPQDSWTLFSLFFTQIASLSISIWPISLRVSFKASSSIISEWSRFLGHSLEQDLLREMLVIFEGSFLILFCLKWYRKHITLIIH